MLLDPAERPPELAAYRVVPALWAGADASARRLYRSASSACSGGIGTSRTALAVMPGWGWRARSGGVARGTGFLLALNGARAGVAAEVPDGAALVVGAGRAGAPERLLADHGAGGLVVDVVVARRVAQLRVRLVERLLVLGEHGSREAVDGGRVHEPQHLVPAAVVVDVRREDGCEQLVRYEDGMRIGDFEQRGFDEPPRQVVGPAAEESLGLGPCALEGRLVVAKLPTGDDGAQVGTRDGGVAHHQRAGVVDDLVAESGPEAAGGIEARGGRAFLPLVTVGGADAGKRGGLDVRRRVDEDEALAAGLAHEARVAAVAGDVRAHRLPNALERWSRAGERNRGQGGMRECDGAELGALALHDIDDPIGQARFDQQLQG